MSKQGWWYRATTEERLAQIDAAIELGMTSKQVAVNCGCWLDQQYVRGSPTVLVFAARHGRRFPNQSTALRRRNVGKVIFDGEIISRRKARIESAKQAYLAGEPIDMWGVE